MYLGTQASTSAEQHSAGNSLHAQAVGRHPFNGR